MIDYLNSLFAGKDEDEKLVAMYEAAHGPVTGSRTLEIGYDEDHRIDRLECWKHGSKCWEKSKADILFDFITMEHGVSEDELEEPEYVEVDEWEVGSTYILVDKKSFVRENRAANLRALRYFYLEEPFAIERVLPDGDAILGFGPMSEAVLLLSEEIKYFRKVV